MDQVFKKEKPILGKDYVIKINLSTVQTINAKVVAVNGDNICVREILNDDLVDDSIIVPNYKDHEYWIIKKPSE